MEDDRDDRRDEPRGGGDAEEGTKLYIGNLSYNTRESDLEDHYSKYGKVKDVRIATDRQTGRSKGFGFVSMADEKDAKDAVDATHGTELDGRTLKVEISQNRPREERRGGDDRRRDDRGGRNGGGGGGRGICYDFQNGKCSRGSSCRFSHEGGGGGGRDYDRGRGGRDYDRGRDRRSRSRDRDRRDRSRDRSRDRRDRYDDRYRDDRRDRDRRRSRSR